MEHIITVYDQKILLWLNRLVAIWGFLNKLLAEYLIYIVPIALLWLWFFSQKSKKVAMRALASAVVAWVVLARTVGLWVHRDRPFDVGGVRELLFHRPDYSFPSDHATVFFAVAASFYFSGNKKLAYVFFGMAMVNSIFRVATGLHWPSDVIVGAVFGVVSAWLIFLFDKPLDIIYEFILNIARKLRLA